MRIASLFLLSVLLLHTDCLAAEELTAESFTALANRTSGGMVYPRDFFKHFALDARVEQLLGKKRYAVMKKELHVEHPAEVAQGVLRFGMCRPHACPFDTIDFYIDLASGKMSACSFETEKGTTWHEEGAAPKAIDGLACGGMDVYDKMKDPEKYRRQDEENKRTVAGTWEGSLDMEQKDKNKPFVAAITLRIAPDPAKPGAFVFSQTLEMRLKDKKRTFTCSNASAIVIQSEGSVAFAWGEVTLEGKVTSGAQCSSRPVEDSARMQDGDLFPYHSSSIGLLHDFRLKKRR